MFKNKLLVNKLVFYFIIVVFLSCRLFYFKNKLESRLYVITLSSCYLLGDLFPASHYYSKLMIYVILYARSDLYFILRQEYYKNHNVQLFAAISISSLTFTFVLISFLEPRNKIRQYLIRYTAVLTYKLYSIINLDINIVLHL